MTKKNVLEKVVFGWGGEVVFGVWLRVWVKFFIKLKWRNYGRIFHMEGVGEVKRNKNARQIRALASSPGVTEKGAEKRHEWHWESRGRGAQWRH